MLQKSLLFLHTEEEEENYNEGLGLNSIKTSFFSDFSSVFKTCIVITILGLLGNGIVLCLFCCAIKKTKFTIYVANLTAGDFFAMLRSCISFLEFFFPSLINTRVRQLMLVVFFFGHETSSYFLAAMSTERCLTVFSPVWYQSCQQKCPTAFVCVFVWTISITLKLFDYFLCSAKYISALNLDSVPCRVVTLFTYITVLIILSFAIIISTLAVCIRMKRKPQQNFPATLDITIWIAVVLHLMFSTGVEIIHNILLSPGFTYHVEFYFLSIMFYCIKSSVNPFVYLLVGCWKWEKGREPFYLFLERALKDNGNGSVRTQPDQEQA